MTAGSAPPPLLRTVDVALEARVRRWTVEERDTTATLGGSATVPADERIPSEAGDGPIRVAFGGAMRVAVLAGAAPDLERVLRRAVLASGAELVLLLRVNDARSFTERAAAVRDARPDLVLALAAERREADGIVDLVEALRLGCADRSPAPRVVVAGESHAALRVKAAAVGFAVELLPDPRRPDGISAFAHRARDFRRGTDATMVLRDEALEELARLIAARGSDALVIDVAGGSTSLVRASVDGTITAAHVASLGSGTAADRTVGRAGLDGVRRWIPWAIDAPTMLERVFNRARWPDAVASEASALALEIALAHESVSHALADAGAAGLAGPLRDAPLTIVTGAAASCARAAHTALVAIDGLASPKPTTLYRDADEALVAIGAYAARIRAQGGDPAAAIAEELAARLAPIAFVVPVTPGRRSKLRVNGVDYQDEELVSGAFFSVRHRGVANVEVTGTPVRTRGIAGDLGIIVDARGRPLLLPPRDAERIPTLVGWFAALDIGVSEVA
ncbi:MAG: hypothetical protein M3O64_05085 [Chloroflexota bacterium]|nr:hypothetical protein [Chloroflexota bacterium]